MGLKYRFSKELAKVSGDIKCKRYKIINLQIN